MSQDKVLRRIRALLAQAEDRGVTPEEAEAFSAKAEELMAKYAIDQVLLQAEGTAHSGEKPELRVVTLERPYQRPKATLLNAIATHMRCQVVMHTPRGTAFPTHCRVVGFASDLDAVELLYTSLLLQLTNAMLAEPTAGLSAGEVFSFRTSFAYGYAGRVYHRMKEAQKRAEETLPTKPGAELVLRGREDKVDAFAAEAFGRVRKSKTSIGNSRAYRAGDEAARTADLGNRRVGGRKRELA